MTHALHEPIRQEQKSGKAHEKAINEIHETWLRPVSVAAVNKRLGAQGNPARPPGIEGVETGKVYNISMRNVALFIPLNVGLLLATGLNWAQQPLKASSVESHEGLTISVLPWTEAAQYKEKFPKKSPYAAGILAVQVTLRNDTDDSVKVNLERVRLLVMLSDDNRQQIEPLSSAGVADVALNPIAKDPTARRKIPLPVGIPRGGHDKKWEELEKAARDAGIPGSVAAPHGTLAGLLFFNLQGQFDLLSTAHLYIPEVFVLEKNRSLTYFEIDLSRSTTN
jgi:hypothetical protein